MSCLLARFVSTKRHSPLARRRCQAGSLSSRQRFCLESPLHGPSKSQDAEILIFSCQHAEISCSRARCRGACLSDICLPVPGTHMRPGCPARN